MKTTSISSTFMHRAAMAEVRGDKVARLTFFMNGKELAQAVGQWPPR